MDRWKKLREEAYNRVSAREAQAMRVVIRCSGKTTDQMAHEAGVTRAAFDSALQNLKMKGFVRTFYALGTGMGGRDMRSWEVTDAGRRALAEYAKQQIAAE